ncbi:MAG: hypothetical protein P8H59_00045 [Flavobacteriales bacterium]|nr:hypothetical protein [Flavobacteriales bacterium]MDG1779314.1 hypothetical protein [Flavobacteriales bacterium]MDG2246331.1 hypothetical protein [Flavobacteriales bacterium]
MKYLFGLLSLFLSTLSFAIDNDDCSSAIVVAVGTECTSTFYSTLDATTSGDASPSCGFYQGGDAWYSFTVPASGDFRIQVDDAGEGNPHYSLHSGACGSLTEIICTSGPTNWSDPVLAGQTLYLQIFTFNNTAGAEFDLCVFETVPPVNNHCADAIDLPVSKDCTPQSFTSLYATSDYTVGPDPNCGFFQGGSVWFSFTVPADGQFRVELTDEGPGNPEFYLYTGSCGSLVQYECGPSQDFINISDLSLAGQTMTMRVFRFNSLEDVAFDLCIQDVVMVENDDCANAIVLPVTADCAAQTFDTFPTTEEEGIAPSPGCGFYQGGDVWFTTEVPSSGHLRIESENIEGNSVFTVYTGTCGTMAVYSCEFGSGNFNINDDDLAGETIYIRVFRFNNPDSAVFTLCATEPNTPDYDDCDLAEELTVGSSCSPQAFTTEGCTADDAAAINPNCGFFQDVDAWFTFDMPMSGHLRIDMENTGDGGIAYQLYSGTCGSMERVDCRSNFYHMNIHEDDLAGQTLYLRVYGYNSTEQRDFTLCVWEPMIPDYDFCETAQPLTLTGCCQMMEYSNEFTTWEDDTPSPGCGFYQGNDVCFTAEVPASGLLTIETTQVDFSKPALAIYTGDCQNLSIYECADAGAEDNSGLVIIDDASLIGQTLYIRVFRRNSIDGGVFTLCAYDPTLCGVYEIEGGAQTECDPENGQYDQEVIVKYINAPATGFLNVNGVDHPITGSPQYVMINNQFANFQLVGVTAFFTDDPTCTYTDNVVYQEPLTCYCPGDINNDETVNATDLLLLLGAYGCTENCSVDLNEDGTTDTADLLLLLGQIGEDCPGL